MAQHRAEVPLSVLFLQQVVVPRSSFPFFVISRVTMEEKDASSSWKRVRDQLTNSLIVQMGKLSQANMLAQSLLGQRWDSRRAWALGASNLG